MSSWIGIAERRLHPDLAARPDLDGTSRHVICPQIECAATCQFEAGMVPVAGQDAILNAADRAGNPYGGSDCPARRRAHPHAPAGPGAGGRAGPIGPWPSNPL